MAATVAGIMTRRVVHVGLDDTLRLAKLLFEQHGFHHLLVLDGEGLAGVVSDRDLFRAISPFVDTVAEQRRDAQTLERRVHQIMTRRPVVVAPDRPVAEAAALMLEQDVSCLPVVGGRGQVQGLVTRKDLLRWCAGHLEARA